MIQIFSQPASQTLRNSVCPQKRERLEDFSLPEKKLEEISLNWHSKQGKFNNIFAKIDKDNIFIRKTDCNIDYPRMASGPFTTSIQVNKKLIQGKPYDYECGSFYLFSWQKESLLLSKSPTNIKDWLINLDLTLLQAHSNIWSDYPSGKISKHGNFDTVFNNAAADVLHVKYRHINQVKECTECQFLGIHLKANFMGYPKKLFIKW